MLNMSLEINQPPQFCGIDSLFDIIVYGLCTAVWNGREFSSVNLKEDEWMMRKIFRLSDSALIHMVNHLFQTEYRENEHVMRDESVQGEACIGLTIGCANQYVFRIGHIGTGIQICAEDRGCVFYTMERPVEQVIQIREPRIVYFGKNIREESYTTLEFPGHEQIRLQTQMITLEDYSVGKLQEAGLILFLPFLFYRFLEEKGNPENKRDSLKYFLIRDIVGALNLSLRREELTVFDVQKLKQLCRQMAWKLLAHERWMQDFEVQTLLMEGCDADLDLLERVHQMELQKLQNK